MSEQERPLAEILAERGLELADDIASGAYGEADLEVRSEGERLIGARIATWGEVADTPIGLESFAAGAFTGIDPRKVVLRLEHEGQAAGRGVDLEQRADGAYMTFKVSKTQRGDEVLTLARDGVTGYVSPSYRPSRSRAEVRHDASGRRVTTLTFADLAEVSTTWKPYYGRNAVTFVRALSEKGAAMATDSAADAAETKTAKAPEAPPMPAPDMGPVQASIERLGGMFSDAFDKVSGRLEALEDRARRDIVIPAGSGIATRKAPQLYDWVNVAIRSLAGERVPARELEERALEDVTTSDAPGVVPDAFMADIIGLIEPQRPFLESTRQVTAPPSGMSIVVPVLGTRATVDVQATEKADIDSTTPTVTTQSFDAVSIFGGADVSIQLLRRSSPQFGELLMQELAEALAAKEDAEALDALITATPTPGTGTLDPEALAIGEAWANSLTNYRRPPTHIWMSSAAVQDFMDAKGDGTNAPLYSNMAADFTVGGGIGGRIQGLIPVYVPALDATLVDVLIGPAAGFAWAEVPNIELSVDVPSKAGRDIALGAILFFMPRYPAAFTTYALA